MPSADIPHLNIFWLQWLVFIDSFLGRSCIHVCLFQLFLLKNPLILDLYKVGVNSELLCQFLPCHMFVHHMVDSFSDLISGSHNTNVKSKLSYQFLLCHTLLRRIVNSFSGGILLQVCKGLMQKLRLSCQFLCCHRFLRNMVNSLPGIDFISGSQKHY